MAFADLYPLDEFTGVAHLAWWRGSDVETAISDMQAKAKAEGRSTYVSDELARARTDAEAADKADRLLIDAHKDLFEAALRAHLSGLREAGALASIGGLRGRDVGLASAWNDIVAGRPDGWHAGHLISKIGTVFTKAFVRMDDRRHQRGRKPEATPWVHVPPTAEQIEAAWTSICASMDSGDSGDSWSGWNIECEDRKSGDRCEIQFAGWRPFLMRRNEEHQLEPALDRKPVPLVAASFDVPTGDLLLTDYLRIEGMKRALDFGPEEYGQRLSLNSEEGMANRSIAHAERHDMGYCQTTNTSVMAWRHPDTGAIAILPRWDGEIEDDDGDAPCPGWEKVGAFSCEMWRVTAVDAEVAARLSLAGGGPGREAVDSFLSPASKSPYRSNVVRVAVPAGRWTMRCGDGFPKRMPRHRYGLPKGVRPWCVLTPPQGD